MEYVNGLKKVDVAVSSQHGTLSVRIGRSLYKTLVMRITSEGDGTLAIPSHFLPGKNGETFVKFTTRGRRNKIAAVRAVALFAVELELLDDAEAEKLTAEARHALKAHRAAVRLARQGLEWVAAQLGGTIQD